MRVPRISLSEYEIDPDALQYVPKDVCEKHKVNPSPGPEPKPKPHHATRRCGRCGAGHVRRSGSPRVRARLGLAGPYC